MNGYSSGLRRQSRRDKSASAPLVPPHFGVHRLRLQQEPLDPAPDEAVLVQHVGERVALVDARVVRELRALDEREDDRVLEPLQHVADLAEVERSAWRSARP